MSRRGNVALLAALAALLFSLGCGGGGEDRPPVEPPVPADVPEVDFAAMEPRVRSAIERTRSAVLAQLASAEAWGRYAMVLDAHELYPEAIASYRVARRLAPDEFRWTYFLGRLLQMQQSGPEDLVQVEELLRVSAEQRPFYGPLYVRLGEVLMLQERGDEAIEAFERAVELNPRLTKAHCGWGRVLLAAGRVEEAVARLEIAAEVDSRDWEVQTTLARAYARAGDRERAKAAALLARDLPQTGNFPDRAAAEITSYGVSATVCFKRAKVLAEGGDFENAIRNLKIAEESLPEYAPVHGRLGHCYVAVGQDELAIAHFERAVRLDEGLADAHLELARIHARRGDAGKAAPYFRRAVRLDPAILDREAELRRLLEVEGVVVARP